MGELCGNDGAPFFLVDFRLQSFETFFSDVYVHEFQYIRHPRVRNLRYCTLGNIAVHESAILANLQSWRGFLCTAFWPVF